MKGFVDDHEPLPPSLAEQLAGTMFDNPPPPPPPTGPKMDPPEEGPRPFQAYRAWRLTEDGKRGYAFMLEAARRELLVEAERISVARLREEARLVLQVSIQNTWTPWIADDLVVDDPRLLDYIERRNRKKPKL